MTSRFSPDLFARVAADDIEEPVADSFVPGLLSSAGCEELGLLAMGEPEEELFESSDDVYVPEHYEPNYPYPLIAWLHTAPPRARDWQRMMKRISDRNYVGVSMLLGDRNESERQVFETVARLRRKLHLHSERIYLLGFEEAGTRALELGLAQPGWFGGIAAISAAFPAIPRPLARFEELRGKRILLGLNERDDAGLAAEVQRSRRLLWGAGMQVSCYLAQADDHYASLLREIDRWIMRDIEQPELVCEAERG